MTAQGSTFRDGAIVRLPRPPRAGRNDHDGQSDLPRHPAGLRRCHHHPFEVYGQDEFYSFAAYFARIGRKGQGISPPISGGEEPSSRRSRAGEAPADGEGDVAAGRCLASAAEPAIEATRARCWPTGSSRPQNPYFARVIVNRVWADLMGRGLVEPVDDLRATNPPTNPALLDALADDFRKNGYDLKKLLRHDLTSQVYALSSLRMSATPPTRGTIPGTIASACGPRSLLDAVSRRFGVPETFAAMPRGSRATEIWTHRSNRSSSTVSAGPTRTRIRPASVRRHHRGPGPAPDEFPEAARQSHATTGASGQAGRRQDIGCDTIVEELYLLVV